MDAICWKAESLLGTRWMALQKNAASALWTMLGRLFASPWIKSALVPISAMLFCARRSASAEGSTPMR